MTKHWLHITNGDSASNTIEKCGVQGQVLPWRDVLHDGPVPGHVSRERLSDERARFLADPLFGGYQRVRADFAERDELLNRAGEFDEVVLWFEHDLYDQLQILQILDWLADLDLGSTRLSMICIDAFPGIEPFYGIGQLIFFCWHHD